MEKLQYCKIMKEWGGFPIDHELWIGEPKAGFLKASQHVRFIDPPKKTKKPKVETATLKPKAETADLPPDIPLGVTHRPATKAEEKARVKAEAKEKAEAEKKAKADAKAEADKIPKTENQKKGG